MNGLAFTNGDRRIFLLGAGGAERAARLRQRLGDWIFEGRETEHSELAVEISRRLHTAWLSDLGARELTTLAGMRLRGGRLGSRLLAWLAPVELKVSLQAALRQAASEEIPPWLAAGVHGLARAVLDFDQLELTQLAIRLPPELRRIFVSALRRLLCDWPAAKRSTRRWRRKLELEHGRDGGD